MSFSSEKRAKCRTTLCRPASLLVLLAFAASSVTGQATSPHSTRDSTIQPHFEAAQQAQLNNDFVTAEREYALVVAAAPSFAEAHMNLGLVYQLEHRDPEAMKEYARALKIKPALSGANFFLGVDYCNLGDGTRAVPFLKAAVRADPNRVDPWSWLATALEMSGDLPAELLTVNRALSLHPENMDLLYQLGHTYERMGKQEVDALGKIAPRSSRSEELLAQSYASSSEWPSAVIHFENALAASPNQRGLHVELGEVLLQAGKLKRAASEFDKELAVEPHSLRALVRRGELKLIDDDVDGSLRDWSRAISVDQPQVERVLGLRGTIAGEAGALQLTEPTRVKLGQTATELRSRTGLGSELALAFVASQDGNSSSVPDKTVNDLSTKRVALTPACAESVVSEDLGEERFSEIGLCALRLLKPASPPDFRMRIAAAWMETGEYDAALTALSGLPFPVRHSAEASYWFARCYEKLATAAYLRLYKSSPNSYRAHQLLGDLDAAKEEDKEAMAEYRLAIQLKPSLPNLHYSLGHLLWKHLETDEARRELEEEVALNPNHAGALNDLGDTYLLDQQPDKALVYLNRALALDVENPEIHRDLGTAYSELGDYRKASTELTIALPTDRDGSIHFKLGRAYQALGEKDKAKREFEMSGVLNRQSHSRLEKQTERLEDMEN